MSTVKLVLDLSPGFSASTLHLFSFGTTAGREEPSDVTTNDTDVDGNRMDDTLPSSSADLTPTVWHDPSGITDDEGRPVRSDSNFDIAPQSANVNSPQGGLEHSSAQDVRTLLARAHTWDDFENRYRDMSCFAPGTLTTALTPDSEFERIFSREPSSPLSESDEPEEPSRVRMAWNMVAEQAVILTGTRTFVPQRVYRPYTEADWLRYVRDVQLKEPIFFYSSQAFEWGVSLEDALKARPEYLKDKDERMFIGCGPSVSIRLQWPGYHPWAKQISTMEFKTPKQPITKAKLAKNIANCVRHFIEIEKQAMDADVNRRWRVGKRNIKVEDLMLVSLHHVSKGSWQPQLRLRRPLLELALPHHQDSTFASSSAS